MTEGSKKDGTYTGSCEADGKQSSTHTSTSDSSESAWVSGGDYGVVADTEGSRFSESEVQSVVESVLGGVSSTWEKK